MPILGLCRVGPRLYTFGVVPPCSAGPIATVAPAHRGWFVAYPDITAFFWGLLPDSQSLARNTDSWVFSVWIGQ
jgi:hypothetical protein